MDKFPVTSRNGNTYMIEILKDTYVSDFYYVVLLQEKLNWRKKLKFKPVYGNHTWSRTYDGSKHNFDFVKMAQLQVEHYESIIEEECQKEMVLEKGYENFDKWDGVCE